MLKIATLKLKTITMHFKAIIKKKHATQAKNDNFDA